MSFEALKMGFAVLELGFEVGHNVFKQVKMILQQFMAVNDETHFLYLGPAILARC